MMPPFPRFQIFLFLAALSLLACDIRAPQAPPAAPPAAPAPLGPLLSMGRVVDAVTGKPVPGALITIDGREALPADANGFFPLRPAVKRIAGRAYGYGRDELIVSAPLTTVELRLRPVRPKALYLTVYGISSKSLRDAALKLIDATELNALVIDMKGDRGLIPYKSSLFQYGIPGYRNPVANSYKIVYLTLKRAQERAKLPASRFRPWLQAFRDYAFDRRYFRGQEIREQIRAAEDFGADGWMLWNPRNIYGADGLKK